MRSASASASLLKQKVYPASQFGQPEAPMKPQQQDTKMKTYPPVGLPSATDLHRGLYPLFTELTSSHHSNFGPSGSLWGGNSKAGVAKTEKDLSWVPPPAVVPCLVESAKGFYLKNTNVEQIFKLGHKFPRIT